MDQIVLEKKMDAILRCIERIENKMPETRKMFLLDLDAQDVVVLNLTRAIQLSVDLAMHICGDSREAIPQTMGEAFDRLLQLKVLTPTIADKMKKSVGFRNIAIHNYTEIDLSLVYTIAKEHRTDFVEFLKQIDTYSAQS